MLQVERDGGIKHFRWGAALAGWSCISVADTRQVEEKRRRDSATRRTVRAEERAATPKKEGAAADPDWRD